MVSAWLTKMTCFILQNNVPTEAADADLGSLLSFTEIAGNLRHSFDVEKQASLVQLSVYIAT